MLRSKDDSPGLFPLMLVERQINNSAGRKRNQGDGSHQRKSESLGSCVALRIGQLILWRVGHRETSSVAQEHLATAPVPRVLRGIVNLASGFLRHAHHRLFGESLAGLAVPASQRRATSRYTMGNDTGYRFREALVL